MTLSFGIVLHFLAQFVTAIRALTRKDREPASRAAWLLLVMAVPVIGVVAYFLVGEANIGRRTERRMAAARRALSDHRPAKEVVAPEIPEAFAPVFRRAGSVNGFAVTGGNSARLMPDENAAIDALVAEIDAARSHVHMLFYIWLEDRNGSRLLDAVERAAARGVTCRLLIDGVGSWRLARSPRWAGLRAKGVKTAITFRMLWLPLHVFLARVDLRNHRKIAVIDGVAAYCGSQNCADPEFRPKARFAPWVDLMMRLEGPVVRQMQHLFAVDWMTHGREEIADLLDIDPAPVAGGFPAVAVGTGPNIDSHAVSDLFAMLLNGAAREAVITTPYFVPDETLKRAIVGAALRGVAVTLILPARVDSVFVARASRSYFLPLLNAGVRLAEYRPGLLHAKTMTIDGLAACIGSANMDRRSFELNYESNLYLVSEEVAGEIRARQIRYLGDSRVVTRAEVVAWPWYRRAVCNLFATAGPLL